MTRTVEGRGRTGFTLMELMIVVAIIGILAAVAIPAYRHYIKKSIASEAYTVLQGIREKEEAYFAELRRYTPPIPYTPGGSCADSEDPVNWEGDASIGDWQELGFAPSGPTYYAYRVDSPYDDEGNHDGSDPAGSWSDVGTTWPDNVRPWFVAEACGDIDENGDEAHFYISSHNKNVYEPGADKGIY